jgi:hypothetical protein
MIKEQCKTLGFPLFTLHSSLFTLISYILGQNQEK